MFVAEETAHLSEAQAQAAPGEMPFDSNTVREMARKLAAEPYKAPSEDLPAPFNDLGYDQYRDIRYRPDRALWAPENLPFQMQLFHRGFLYKPRVDMFEVANGVARPIRFNRDLFSYQNMQPPPPDQDLGFAGFRLHGPINRADYYDEICAFLGASYFRALGKGHIYGLSARGLALNTADPKGEEFPVFRSFWVERPREGVNAITVHALLDSPSCAAAFRFAVRPGPTTIFDVECTIFPRTDLTTAGIAPLTSMFWFSPLNRTGRDDWRPAVHDSDGLLILTGRGERIWRPLNNPRNLEISIFSDVNPRGYGLMQRRRDFASYEDLEARYEKRPSLWIEPIGDWGEGAVHLVEIPTSTEIHDNVVVFWRPKDPLKAKGEYRYTFRMHWCDEAPVDPGLARITAVHSGAGTRPGLRYFVLDAVGGALRDLPADAKPQLDVSASRGEILNPVVYRNPETGGWRIAFELAPGDARSIELRAQLRQGEQPLAETWLYRWTA
ncbi:glucan biosynthesis protein [Roseomonas marmotae]|uniref:Glucans biosynthesis protein G n=1 Tax=Roseomonas marmotae TaxID=2768161 RepID=A0ABS3KBE3_9PROT|nr:glucan biosynthesis protein G [Roseomonas marmotae]MBO1074757.1 glucan biosynthesis protein G [Roseomonas marmotae]QTI80889.1 glucan biosynthesis protein G [Roseomonas marmotae]